MSFCELPSNSWFQVLPRISCHRYGLPMRADFNVKSMNSPTLSIDIFLFCAFRVVAVQIGSEWRAPARLGVAPVARCLCARCAKCAGGGMPCRCQPVRVSGMFSLAFSLCPLFRFQFFVFVPGPRFFVSRFISFSTFGHARAAMSKFHVTTVRVLLVYFSGTLEGRSCPSTF